MSLAPIPADPNDILAYRLPATRRRTPHAVFARYEALAAVAPARGGKARRARWAFERDAAALVRRTLDDGLTDLAAFWPALDGLLDRLADTLPTVRPTPPVAIAAHASVAELRRRVAMAGVPPLARGVMEETLAALAADAEAVQRGATAPPAFLGHLIVAEGTFAACQAAVAAAPAGTLEGRLHRAVQRAFLLVPPAARRLTLATLLGRLERLWSDGLAVDPELVATFERELACADGESGVLAGLRERFRTLARRVMTSPLPANVADAALEHVQVLREWLDAFESGERPAAACRDGAELAAARLEALLALVPPAEAMPAAVEAAIAETEGRLPLQELPGFMGQGIRTALADLAGAARVTPDAGAIPDFRSTLARWTALVDDMASAASPTRRGQRLLDALARRYAGPTVCALVRGTATDVLERLRVLLAGIETGELDLATFRQACQAATPRLDALLAWNWLFLEPLP